MKAIVLLSGGLDSTVVCTYACRTYGAVNVLAMIFDYGQRHSKEIEAAKAVCKALGCEYIKMNVSAIFAHSKSALMYGSEQQIPDGPYDCTQEPVTSVPFRNGVLLSIAASYALEHAYDQVWCGIHQDDAGAAYADTSPDFFVRMQQAVEAGTNGQVELCAPYLYNKKSFIVSEGVRYGAPLGLTWSCYKGGKEPCGKCATCLARAKAFSDAGEVDPALYGTSLDPNIRP